jgi:hypothetical protein
MTSNLLEPSSLKPLPVEKPALPGRRFDLRRAAPTLLAGALALAYAIASPPSLDLAAHLLRAKLFSSEAFGLWNNWWYAGHHVMSYSVLFPPVAAALTPQVAAAIAATATAAMFEPLARRHFGERAWLGALWFGAATATNLFTGRLTFAFGLLPAVATALALQRRRPVVASALAVVTALASPVAALFAALAGIAFAIGSYADTRRLRAVIPGVSAALAALVPVALLAIVFPEGGSEPFTFATLWPIAVIALIALLAIPRRDWTLRAGIALYALGCIAAYVFATPVGSNAARLGSLVAGPLAGLLWWRKRNVLLIAAALPLLYLQWQAPVRDVRTSSGDHSASAAYYRPLLSFLAHQPGPPFRVEIPFTQFHWEAYQLAPQFPLARGWERQLDIKYNHLFYGGPLTPATYLAWLHEEAVRFVAVSDARLDYSAHKEKALIDRELPYLRLVLRTRHWRVYAVAGATAIVRGAATLRAIGPNSLTLGVAHPGIALARVHFTPYWTLEKGAGCVKPNGQFVTLNLRRTGTVRLVIKFALGRIGARSPRCG